MFFSAAISFALPSCSASNYGSLVLQKEESQGDTFRCVRGITSEKAVYKTDIDVFGRHFSGLMLIKRNSLNDYRIVFISQVGLSIFDYGLKNGVFTDYYSIDYIKDNGMASSVLRDDLRLILSDELSPPIGKYYSNSEKKSVYKFASGKNYNYYFMDGNACQIERIEKANDSYKITVVEYSDYSEGYPGKITLRHFNFDLRITCMKINGALDE